MIEDWGPWIKLRKKVKRETVENIIGKQKNQKREVLAIYSQIPLKPGNPSKDYGDPFYPSLDHVDSNRENNNESNLVLETRLVNDMKSILDEKEFWRMIEHLYCVGKKNGKVKSPARILPENWKPKRDYKKKK